MSSSTASSIFQAFLDNAVAQDIAPGFQCVVFDRENVVYNGVSGLSKTRSEEHPEGVPLRPENIFWLASCSKILTSLVVLHIIEKGLTKTGFYIEDLDSHDALVKVLPEFKHGSGSPLTKIIEGFEDELGPDGRKVMKLRDATGCITLRMLLTQTAGIGYDWNHHMLAELYRPSDGSAPTLTNPFYSGNLKDLEVPLVAEPNTYRYGFASDWVGEFAVRSTGKSLRRLYKEIILEPLHIPSSEADIYLSPALQEARAGVFASIPQGGHIQLPMNMVTGYMAEDMPPEGKTSGGGGCLYSSLQSYAILLRAVLNQDPRILSKGLWQLVMKDDLKERGITVPRPAWKSAMLDLSHDVAQFFESTTGNGVGVNLLQCQVATTPTVSGRSAGSFAWAGLTNIYYFIDPVKGVGAVFGAQTLPFFSPQMVGLRDKFEALVYETMFSK